MTQDRWSDLIERFADDEKIESRTTEELDGRPGTVERVVVASPLGKMRLSWTSEPKRIQEKALYSKRGSSTVNITRSYDESEIIHVFSVERYDNATANWQPIDATQFSL